MLVTIITGLIGAILGMSFADIDLAPPLPVKHRSAWTHGLPIPLAVWWLSSQYPAAWSFAGVFLITYALHLLFDMFPRKWKGSALINLYPVPISLPAFISFFYLLAGVVSALWVSALVMGYDAWLVALYHRFR